MNQQGLGEAGFVETGGRGNPWFPRKDEGRQVRLQIRWARAGLTDTKVNQGESVSCWVGWGDHIWQEQSS